MLRVIYVATVDRFTIATDVWVISLYVLLPTDTDTLCEFVDVHSFVVVLVTIDNVDDDEVQRWRQRHEEHCDVVYTCENV